MPVVWFQMSVGIYCKIHSFRFVERANHSWAKTGGAAGCRLNTFRRNRHREPGWRVRVFFKNDHNKSSTDPPQETLLPTINHHLPSFSYPKWFSSLCSANTISLTVIFFIKMLWKARRNLAFFFDMLNMNKCWICCFIKCASALALCFCSCLYYYFISNTW